MPGFASHPETKLMQVSHTNIINHIHSKPTASYMGWVIYKDYCGDGNLLVL